MTPNLTFAIALAAGVAGSMVDSVLGATLQATYHCPRCNRQAEGSVHACGMPTQHVRGLRWFDNDRVNLVATGTGAALSALAVHLLS